jgi:hypothetical protein
LNVFGATASAPTNLVAAAGDGQITLSWPTAIGASGYNLKSSLVSGNAYTTIASNLTFLTFTNSGLLNGTMYYFVVTATNAAGESANSIEAGAHPVSLISPVLSYDIAGNSIIFSWPSDHLGWQLQAQTNAFGYGLGTNWVTVSFSESSNQYVISTDPTDGSIFFRLTSP